ncbi:hypothetical protein IPG36_00955 [bacterium]|nr:MAG: hypothetical protein IPG36_00955 [bacterium]
MATKRRLTAVPRINKWLALAVMAIVVAAGVTITLYSRASTVFSDNFSSYATGTCLADGTALGQWNVVYAGGGCVKVGSDATMSWLEEASQVAAGASETHASLVTGPALTGAMRLDTKMRTVTQLRTGTAPNAWETAWVIWNYTDNTHFYYFTLKPNGWELGKEDPAYPGAQRFLQTGSQTVFDIASWHDIVITQDAVNTITVSVDGTQITSFTDTERPYTSGKIGLYNEDARVQFTNISAGTLSASTPTPTPSTAPTTTPGTPAGMRAVPDPLYGVTADDVSNTAAIIASSQHFSHLPTTRIVFDENTTPSDYTTAVNALQPYTYLLGELSDSEYMAAQTVQQYHDRTASFLAAFGTKIDIWEIGNEVNGDWTGPYTDVAAKITDAYHQVAAAGKRSELTLWYNPGCAGSARELDPVSFANQYLPSDVKSGLTYVTNSYYETQCNNYRPTAAVVTTLMQQLHAIFPNSKLGFGEIGLPNPATANTLSKAQDIANYYYSLNINLPYYIGGYFYWYYAEDALPYTTKPIWQTLNTAFTNMPYHPASTSPTPLPVAGDINGDSKVNVFDLSALLTKWGTATASSDLNHDGTVNIFDLSILLGHWTG